MNTVYLGKNNWQLASSADACASRRSRSLLPWFPLRCDMKHVLGLAVMFLLAATSFAAEGKGPFPALIVIHEWWGLNDWVKEQASKLADQGYAALAIDLYRGKVAGSPEEAHEMMRGVPEDRAARDLKAAFAYLASQQNVDKSKIGSIGWCMGGGYSLQTALVNPELKATVINYGHLATEPETLKKINAAVLGIFGGQDRGIPVDDVKKFESQLKSL